MTALSTLIRNITKTSVKDGQVSLDIFTSQHQTQEHGAQRLKQEVLGKRESGAVLISELETTLHRLGATSASQRKTGVVEQLPGQQVIFEGPDFFSRPAYLRFGQIRDGFIDVSVYRLQRGEKRSTTYTF